MAEIYALSETARAAQLISWKCNEIGIDVSIPLCLQVDNMQSKSFQEGTCIHSRLRGIVDMRLAWVKELRDKPKIKVKWIAGDRNKADLLTKCFPNWIFQQRLKLVQKN